MNTTHQKVSVSPVRVACGRNANLAARLIGIAVFDGFSILPAAELVDVFDKANQVLTVGHRDVAPYRTIFVSSHGGCVSSSANVDVLTQTVEQLHVPRAVFVAGGDFGDDALEDLRFGEWLRDLASRTDSVFSIGNGESVLSAIGLPRRSAYARTQAPFSNVRFSDVPGDNAFDCAARSAVHQALEMIRQDFGVSTLRRVLERLPDAGLANFNAITGDSVKSIKERIHDSAQWITLNCNKPISITVAAQTAGMSDRSYLRHFRAEMGMKPSEYLRRSRVERAAALLESSDLPVDKIARRCGLTSGECLARLFRQVLHISPTDYRSRVRSAYSRT